MRRVILTLASLPFMEISTGTAIAQDNKVDYFYCTAWNQKDSTIYYSRVFPYDSTQFMNAVLSWQSYAYAQLNADANSPHCAHMADRAHALQDEMQQINILKINGRAQRVQNTGWSM